MERYYHDLSEVTKVVTDLESNLEQAIEFDHVLIHTGRLLRHRGMLFALFWLAFCVWMFFFVGWRVK